MIKEATMKKISTGKTFVGLDVHKESIDVTLDAIPEPPAGAGGYS